MPIPKFDSASKPEDYRPVSLTAIIGKLMEKVLDTRLRLELENRLQPYQRGFRSGKATTMNVEEICNCARSLFRKGKVSGVLSLDIRKAFDSVNHDALLVKLWRLGIRGKMFYWIRAFLTNRKSCVRLPGHVSKWMEFEFGVPQGSVISPFLFLVYIDDIFEKVYSRPFLFADDGILFIEADTLMDLEQILNHDMRELEAWSDTWKLAFTPEKFQLMLFETPRQRSSTHDEFQVKYKDSTITNRKLVKYLGFLIDSKLKWNYHVDWILERCEKKFNVMLMLRNLVTSWRLRDVYISFIRSYIDYGCWIYGQSKLKSVLSKLERFQNKALRVITGLPRWTSSEFLHLETSVLPLEIRRTSLASKGMVNSLDSWNVEWKRIKKCREHPFDAKLFPTTATQYSGVDISKQANCSRKLEKLFFRIRSNTLIMNFDEQPCKCGLVQETANHILLDCEFTELQRKTSLSVDMFDFTQESARTICKVLDVYDRS